MTFDSVAAIISVVSALLGVALALLRLQHEVTATHRLVNSRMDELVALTRKSAKAEGKLEGPDPPAGDIGSGAQ